MITFDHLQAALALTEFDAPTAQLKMSPNPRGDVRRNLHYDTPPREAAVLVLIYPHTADDLRLVLTRRTEKLAKHSGQVSFPGGRRDENDASFVATALRETCEELGFCDTSQLQIIGTLAQCYIPPSHFQVQPVVATLPFIPEFYPSPDEVAEVLTFSLLDLLHPATKQHEYWQMQGYNVSVPYYAVQGHKVWGATAVMLSELEQRLRAVLPTEVMMQLHADELLVPSLEN
jgi:8-oxo-dGTP pyrophosphatase MutT (NUDIX family)